jgi:hypothetical protein
MQAVKIDRVACVNHPQMPPGRVVRDGTDDAWCKEDQD